MGREFASAAARWIHLTNLDVRPVIVAACDSNTKAFDWFKASIPTLDFVSTDYRELLARQDVDAIYCTIYMRIFTAISYGPVSICSGKNRLALIRKRTRRLRK
jgi:hypothetical protein